MDNYLRERAAGNGAKLYNGLFLRMEQKEGEEGPFTIQFSNYEDGGKARARDTWSSPSPCAQPAVLIKPLTAESSRHQQRAEWLIMAAQPSSGLFAFWTSCCLRQPPATRSGLNHRTSSAGGQAGQHRGGRGHRRRRRQQPRRQGDWRWRLRLRHCLPGAPALQLRVALSSACQPDGSEPCSRTYFEENSCIQSSWSSVAAAANGVSGEPEQTFGKACDAALLPLRTTWCGCRSASASPRRRWSTTRT